MLRVYALAPETLRRIMRRTFWRFQALVTFSFLMFGLYLAFLGGPIRWEAAGPILVVIALAYFFAIFFFYRTQLRALYSARYEIDGSSIAYRQAGQDPLRIMRADIASVHVRKDGLWVETTDQSASLLIPRGLARDGDEDFRETLGAWVGVVPIEARPRAPLGPQFAIAIGGSLLVLLFANSLVIILPLLVAAVVMGFGLEQRLALEGERGAGHARMYSLAFNFLIFVILMKSCLIASALVLGR